MNSFTLQAQRAASIFVSSAALFLGGCAGLTTASVDPVANSNALADCTITAIKPLAREKFAKAAELERSGRIQPGMAETYGGMVVLDMLERQDDDRVRGAMVACAFQVSKTPASPDSQTLSALFESHFDAVAFEDKMLARIPVMIEELSAEAKKARGQPVVPRP